MVIFLVKSRINQRRPFHKVKDQLKNWLYLILKWDDPGLDDLEGVVWHGLGDGVLLELGQVSSDFRKKLTRNHQTHILVHDGLDEGLQRKERKFRLRLVRMLG